MLTFFLAFAVGVSFAATALFFIPEPEYDDDGNILDDHEAEASVVVAFAVGAILVFVCAGLGWL